MMISSFSSLLYVCLLLVSISQQSDATAFDDTIIFDLTWKDENIDCSDRDILTITTSHQEKYQCAIPKQQKDDPSTESNYAGSTASDILEVLFNQAICSYRFEPYWTYEVCHGKYVRQYHETADESQMFTLGQWQGKEEEINLNQLRNDEMNRLYSPPVTKVNNLDLPYIELVLSNGSSCELQKNTPRQTRVLYVCDTRGNHKIYSVKEIKTCEYEVIILSPFLCTHPKYRPKRNVINEIQCFPLDTHPKKPYNLVKLHKSRSETRQPQDFKIEFLSVDSGKSFPLPHKTLGVLDVNMIENFLSGDNCITGGTGYWRYKFCYGKSVVQYHSAKDDTSSVVTLGNFDKATHIEWLKKHPHKRPQPISIRMQLSHFYSNGCICNTTGKPRQTEVQLKCLNNAPNVNYLALYLYEYNYGEYILGVESPIICHILSRADDDGIIPVKIIKNTETSSLNSNTVK